VEPAKSPASAFREKEALRARNNRARDRVENPEKHAAATKKSAERYYNRIFNTKFYHFNSSAKQKIVELEARVKKHEKFLQIYKFHDHGYVIFIVCMFHVSFFLSFLFCFVQNAANAAN